MILDIQHPTHPLYLRLKGGTTTERWDRIFKAICRHVIKYGSLDKNPRPVWIEKDGSKTPAHSYSINNVTIAFNIPDGDLPLNTLRRTAWWMGGMEIQWIYVEQSNDLVVFDQLINRCTWEEDHQLHNWWKQWALTDKKTGEYILNEQGHPIIGLRYGGTVAKHNLTNKFLNGMKKSPDGRRHLISLWQDSDFELTDGLPPCVHKTQFIVRHEKNGVDYLDVSVDIRSWDFITAGAINLIQYIIFAARVARHFGYKLGVVRFNITNLQIYDRHVKIAKKLCRRKSIPMNPRITFKTKKRNFFKVPANAIKIKGYDGKRIDKTNPQMEIPVAV